MLYNIFVHAFIAQSVERRLGKAEVTGSIPVVGSNDESVRTFLNRDINIILKKDGIFLFLNAIPERWCFLMKIIKEELQFEESVKQRLEFICEFAKVTPTFINGSIRKIENTNLSYIEPHRVIIENTTFLVFNYSNDVYISNLSKKIKLSELEEYLNTI